MYSSIFLLCLLIFSFLPSLNAQAGCPAAPSPAGDRRTDKSKVVIATFNAEWLFLYRNNCPGTGCTWKNIDEAKVHLANIANVIVEINADILVIPETESCTVLKDLLSLNVLANRGYKPYLVPGKDTATGQNVGLITRIDPSSDLLRTENRHDYPVVGSNCGWSGTPTTSGVSKHFYTVFNIPGLPKPLLMMGVHFVAFPVQNDRCSQREAQASVIRDIVVEQGLNKKYEVVVLGDFNDHDPTITDEAGSVGKSKVFNIIRGTELDNVLIKHPNYKTGVGIYSGWWDKNSNCRDDKGGEHTLIDHILTTRTLPIRSIKFFHGISASCTSFISDHWPVIMELSTTVSMEEERPVDIFEVSLEKPLVDSEGDDIGGGVSMNSKWMWAVIGIVGGVAVVGVAVVVGVWGVRKMKTRGEVGPLIV